MKLLLGVFLIIAVLIGATTTGYLSGRAWVLLILALGLSGFFLLIHYKKARKKGYAVLKSCNYAVRKTFFEWYK